MSISFLHSGNPTMASYRYRCAIPAKEMGVEINNPDADILIFAKPAPHDVSFARKALDENRTVVVDFCDPHFGRPEYRDLLSIAHCVTCPTKWFRDYLHSDFGVDAIVVPDPYEFDELEPHCNGDNLLWFGHGSNIQTLGRVIREIEKHPIRIVSNIQNCIQYSRENILEATRISDIVVLPETAPYKSCNRAVEAIRRGCFVVAEPHVSIEEFPGIWKGNLVEGVEWAIANQQEANHRTTQAQAYIRQWYAPSIQASAWKATIQKAQSSSMSGQVKFGGTDGSMLIQQIHAPTLSPPPAT